MRWLAFPYQPLLRHLSHGTGRCTGWYIPGHQWLPWCKFLRHHHRLRRLYLLHNPGTVRYKRNTGTSCNKPGRRRSDPRSYLGCSCLWEAVWGMRTCWCRFASLSTLWCGTGTLLHHLHHQPRNPRYLARCNKRCQHCNSTDYQSHSIGGSLVALDSHNHARAGRPWDKGQQQLYGPSQRARGITLRRCRAATMVRACWRAPTGRLPFTGLSVWV